MSQIATRTHSPDRDICGVTRGLIVSESFRLGDVVCLPLEGGQGKRSREEGKEREKMMRGMVKRKDKENVAERREKQGERDGEEV